MALHGHVPIELPQYSGQRGPGQQEGNAPFSFSTLPHLGMGEKLLLIAFLAAGLVFFYLSFTARHGRSRWPLHGIMALGITAAGTGSVTYVLPLESCSTTRPSRPTSSPPSPPPERA